MARAGIGDRVEGFHAVAAAVQAGRARSVRIEERRLKGSAYTSLAEAARSAGAEVEYVSDVRAHALTSAPQGVVAACEPKQTVSIEEAVDRLRAEGHSISSLHLRFLSPLEPGLKEIFDRFKRVMTVEINYSDPPEAPLISPENRRRPQLTSLLRERTLIDVGAARVDRVVRAAAADALQGAAAAAAAPDEPERHLVARAGGCLLLRQPAAPPFSESGPRAGPHRQRGHLRRPAALRSAAGRPHLRSHRRRGAAAAGSRRAGAQGR